MALTRIDFVHAAPALAGWRLVLLAAGLLGAFGAGANWVVQARAASRLEAALARAQPRMAARVPLAPERQRAQDLQVAAVRDAVRQLNLPVTRLLRALQAPPDIRVALLGLDLDGKPERGDAAAVSGTLKIGAEAASARDMMNYLAFLNEQPLFTSVYLVRHEVNAAAPNRGYRFQMEAQWRE